jgi:hypothetical protein
VVCDGTTKSLYLRSTVIKVESDQPVALAVPVPWQIAAGATGFANARSGTSGATTTVRWHEYPVADGGDGCFYTHSHAGQRILKRFNPSTLVIDTITITQSNAMPSWNTANPGHYSNFFYVPSRRCFALVPGNNQRVALIRP